MEVRDDTQNGEMRRAIAEVPQERNAVASMGIVVRVACKIR